MPKDLLSVVQMTRNIDLRLKTDLQMIRFLDVIFIC